VLGLPDGLKVFVGASEGDPVGFTDTLGGMDGAEETL